MRRATALIALAAALLAVAVFPARADGGTGPLRINDVQAVGTHNSTHRDPTGPAPGVPDWEYSHAPLPQQLEAGVRQLELDVHFNWARDEFEVYHVWFADDRVTCELLRECLTLISDWSAAHPSHHPILVMIEPKDAPLEDEDPFTKPLGPAEYDKLDATILDVVADRTITPDDVTMPGHTLRHSILSRGWPKLDDSRGQLLFLVDGDEHGAAYSDGWTSLAGRMLFVQAAEDADVAAFVTRSGPGPETKYERMARLVRQGFMVRDLVSGAALEALAAGAHYLSTDHPEEVDLGPDADPSRCNPVTTSGRSCLAGDVETHHHADGYAPPEDTTSDSPDRVLTDKVDRLVVRSAEAAVEAASNGRTP